MSKDDGKKRLGAQLSFDPDKEKDILNAIEGLAGSKKLGDLVSHLLRLAFESPEVYGNGQEVRQLINTMMEYGISPTRYNFFNQISRDMETLKKKVDTIYDMAYKTYTLSQMGKFLGIEEKADNCLRATFLLERQITEMCTTLGVTNMNHSFVSNKIQDTHARAEQALEYIIESYDSIINELKASVNIQVSEVRQDEITKPADNETNNVGKLSGGVVDNTSTTVKTEEDIDDEFIELGKDAEETSKEDPLLVKAPGGDRGKLFLDMIPDI